MLYIKIQTVKVDKISFKKHQKNQSITDNSTLIIRKTIFRIPKY